MSTVEHDIKQATAPLEARIRRLERLLAAYLLTPALKYDGPDRRALDDIGREVGIIVSPGVAEFPVK